MRMRNKKRGFILLSLLSLLLFVGAALLSNSRELSSSMLWQVHLTQKRSQLDWRLESALNCLAMNVESLSKFETQACEPDSEFSFAVTESYQDNHYQLTASAGGAVTHAILQLGDLSHNSALVNRAPITGMLSSSAITTAHPLRLFTGYSLLTDLKRRFYTQLTMHDPNDCGAQLVNSVTQGEHAVWIEGGCQISSNEWNTLANLSQSEPLALFFIQGFVLIQGTQTLNGLVALIDNAVSDPSSSYVNEQSWDQFSSHNPNFAIANETRVQFLATPHISGGLIVDLPANAVFIPQMVTLTDNADALMSTRFNVAKRSWVKGSWSDF